MSDARHDSSLSIRILGPGDERVLEDVAADVFDHPPDETATIEFLRDPRHHLAVAIDGTTVVGMISALHYVHPDKPVPELWINELGVAASHRRQGIARRMIDAMLRHGRELGCRQAWVLTDTGNEAARLLYTRAGGTPSEEILVSFDLVDL